MNKYLDVPPRSFSKAYTFSVPITINKMIDCQTSSLHEGIHNHRPDQPKSVLQ